MKIKRSSGKRRRLQKKRIRGMRGDLMRALDELAWLGARRAKMGPYKRKVAKKRSWVAGKRIKLRDKVDDLESWVY